MKNLVFFLSPDGNDRAKGDAEHPFATVGRVQKEVAACRDQINGDVEVHMYGGDYWLKKPVTLTLTDNLPGDKSWRFVAVDGERPIFNAGRLIKNWEPCHLNGNKMFRAHLPDVRYIRRFFIDGKPRQLARRFKTKEERQYFGWIPHTDLNSFEVRFDPIGPVKNPKQMEVVWNPEWKIVMYRAEAIEPGNVIRMNKRYFRRLSTTIRAFYKTERDINGYWWPNPARHPLYLQNDICFVTQSGEFCFDEEERYLYYYPLPEEDPRLLRCIYPYLDEILSINGNGTPNTVPQPLCNISFENIGFGYAAYSHFSRYGLQTNQAQTVYAGATRVKNKNIISVFGNLDAAVNVNYTHNLHFEDCLFENTVAGGLYLHDGVQHTVVRGCVFRNTGDSALILGDGRTASFDEAHMTSDILVENNLIRHVGEVNHCAPGVQAYFIRGLTLRHNDIYDTGYSGIAVGWGWHICMDSTYSRDNTIEYNRVGHFNARVRDGGGIYTLGQQPNSFCRYNYIFEQMNAFGALYHDEGTAYYTTVHNVIDTNTKLEDHEQTWLQLNGFDNGPNGWKSVYCLHIEGNFTNNRRIWNKGEPSNVEILDTCYVEGNQWPEEACQIIDNAGLQREYQHLKDQFQVII